MGRPPKYSDPIVMEKKINEYFEQCDRDKRPYTVAGLSYDLGFLDRESVIGYKDKDEFYRTIKTALLRIHKQRSEALLKPGQPVAGIIFDLKNNFGWVDSRDLSVQHSYDDSVGKVDWSKRTIHEKDEEKQGLIQ